MPCDERTFLETVIDSNANHLQRRLQQEETGDTIFELAEVKRMAQDLVGSLKTLRSHGVKHHCTK
jgi:hypothetical protein